MNVASASPALSKTNCPLTVVDKHQETPSLSLIMPYHGRSGKIPFTRSIQLEG